MNNAENLYNSYMSYTTQIGEPREVTTHHVSEIGHPCDYFLFLALTQPHLKTPISQTLALIFREGNTHENLIIDDLKKAGIKVVDEQHRLEDKKRKISGKIDCVLELEGEEVLVEIKSMSPYIFSTLRHPEDVKNSKFFHIRKYYTQIQLYLSLYNQEKNKKNTKILLFIKNKVTGQVKIFEYCKDEDFLKETYRRIDKINNQIETGETPKPTPGCYCETCPFRFVCSEAQDKEAKEEEELQKITDEETEKLLVKMQELKPQSQEYEKIKRTINKKYKNLTEAISIGCFSITPKQITRKGFIVPESTFTTLKIEFID